LKAIVAAFALVAAVLQLGAQQSNTAQPSVSLILEQMRSPDRHERMVGFGYAANLLESKESTPADQDRLRLGIIELLITENNLIRSFIAKNDRANAPGDEKSEQPATQASSSSDQGECDCDEEDDEYPFLIEYVANMGDERGIPALIGAAGSGGIAIRGAAAFGKKALDPALELVKGNDPDLAERALFVIQKLLEWRTAISDPESHLRIKNALRLALVSPSYGVRYAAIYAVEYMDDREEFVPILKQIAEHDPYKLPNQPKEDGTVGDHYFVRLSAARLLQKIADRTPPTIDRGVPGFPPGCSVTAFIAQANATVDHSLSAPRNQVLFATSFTVYGGCDLPQPVTAGSWSTSDPAHVSISNQPPTPGLATCLASVATPVTVTYSGTRSGYAFTPATLVCK